MYRIAICDDDKHFLKQMEDLLQSNGEFTEDMVVECFDDVDNLLKEDVGKFTLFMIDMCMDALDGFSVAKKVREVNEDAVIVFCSGVIEPKPEHFEVQPYRYIVKQADEKRIANTISEVLKYMKQKYFKTYINIASDGRARKIEANKVLYFSPVKRGTIVKIQEDGSDFEFSEIRSNQKIKEWYAELLQSGFDFPNVSFLVNLAHIRSIDKNVIIMDDGVEILISRLYKKTFTRSFALFFDKKYRRGNAT